MPRIPLITQKDQLPPEHHALFDQLAALRGRVSGPSTIVLHSPALAGSWNQQSEFLHANSVVDHRSSELAIIATARARDCGYIWNAHVNAARTAGASEAAIAAARDNRPLDGLPEAEAAPIAYARELQQTNRISQATFDRMRKGHDARWLVELTTFSGRYAALAGLLNACEVAPAGGAEVLPVPSANPPLPRLGTAPAAEPRVPAILSKADMAAEYSGLFDAASEGRPYVRGPYRMLLYSPGLCRTVLDVSAYLRRGGLVAQNPGELAIIATAREKDCPYVWAAHAPAARRAGISEAAVAAVRDRSAIEGLGPIERDIVDYVRQLLRTNRVEQGLFDRMAERHGIPWLVEMTALMGHYGIVTSILNAFEIAPAPDADKLPLP